jgi:hypothetical protein
MISFRNIGSYLTAEPFRPFRIRMTSGRTFEIRHPDTIQAGRSTIAISTVLSDDPDEAKEQEIRVSYLQIESVEPLDSAHGLEAGPITYQVVLSYLKADPFRSFCIRMANGRTFYIRHPESLKVLRSYLLIFKTTGDPLDFPDGWESVSIALIESISHA